MVLVITEQIAVSLALVFLLHRSEAAVEAFLAKAQDRADQEEEQQVLLVAVRREQVLLDHQDRVIMVH
jgi:hypothetical protein